MSTFNKGDKLEILRTTTTNTTPAWFPATVIDSPSPSGTLHVKFTTLFVEKDRKNGTRKRKKIKDYVSVTAGVIRRVPPPEPHRRFVVGEEVEVLYGCGWRRAVVKEVVEDGRCTVVVGGAVEVVVENRNVRVCCSTASGFDSQQEKSTDELVLQSPKPTKLRIICSKQNSKAAIFQKGARVEARSYEEGYHGARYVATVIGTVGEAKFLVQYDTLTTDDQMQPLVEMVHVSNIRPLPPIIRREHRFNMLEEVDAWYHDGWWVGVVTKVLANLKYVVFFWTTNEELELHHLDLRSHQELINDKWVASFLRPKVAENPRLEKMKLQTGRRTLMMDLLCGLNVEIAHGAGRFLSTWYPAVILERVSSKKYLVGYRTLKPRNGPEHVEEVDVSCIRPSPPIIQQAYQFKPGDAVDAWVVNGWHIGQIRTTMNFKYEVYFWATDSVVEFQHAYLRPHQDFINGAWLGSYIKQE
ncbi:putative Agenet-like domain-containing protein [Helianthus annuus]|nr:putative Agenet-like domain-containing protein [Helianthus annuus]